MNSIPQLPALVISEIAEHEDAIWTWISQTFYTQLQSSCPDDLLVRIQERFSFHPIESVCQDYRLYAGLRGQEATHTIGQLCRALLVKTLKGWSYRQTCHEIQTNGLVRGFVGYTLQAETLSYPTLQRFALWVNHFHPNLFFNEIVRQIDADFPQELAKPQVGDTFALFSNATPQSHTAMLRHACQRLLHLWQQLSPLTPIPGITPSLLEALFGPPNERPEYTLDKSERDEREFHTAVAAEQFAQLLQAAQSTLPPQHTIHTVSLHQRLTILQKMLQDEFVFTRNDQGLPLTARYCTDKERGSFVIGSSIDPQASFRKHGDRNDLGYNIHVAATDNFIRHIFASTGATSDASGVPLLISQQLEQSGHLPPKLIYDRAAGSPKIFHDVDMASGGRTQLVAHLIDRNKNNPRFGPLDFTLNADGSLSCPNGQQTATAYRSASADGWTYRFSAQQCADCPLWDSCRGPRPDAVPLNPDPANPGDAATAKTVKKSCGPKPTSYRQVFITSYRNQQRDAILYTQTPEFQEDMRLRPGIERTIAALTRYNGARRAQSIGLAKADFQVRMAALAFNLKRWRVLTLAQERAQRFRPPAPA